MNQTHDMVLAERGNAGALGMPLPYGPSSSSSEAEGSLAQAIAQRRWTVILVFLLLVGTSVPAILFLVKPQYEVRSTVHVKPVVKPIMSGDSETDISRNYQTYMATQRGIILAPDLIAAALESPKVKELGALQFQGDAVREILKNMTVDRMGSTELLAVGIVGQRPKELEILLNGIVEVYLQRQDQEKRKEDEQALSSLRNEQRDLESRIKVLNEQIRQIAIEAGLDGINFGQPGSGAPRPSAIYQSVLDDARKRRALAEGRLKELRILLEATEGQEGGVALAGYEEFAAKDQLLLDLKTQLRAKEQESLTDRQFGRGPTHPDVTSRPALIASFKEEISKRELELRGIHASSELRKLEAEARDAAITERVTKQQLVDVREESAGQARQEISMLDWQHERTQLENTLSAVRNKIWQVEVEQNRIPRLSLKSPARAPSEPNLDKRMKYGAIAVIGSLFMGIGVAFLRQRTDSRLRSVAQVQERLGVRVLGSVMQIPTRNGATASTLELALQEPVRSISTALLAGGNHRKTHSRLITSPTPGSGKSSMALNLARSLAATGRTVLLVDGDNQRQSISKQLGLRDQPGLFELLAGERLGVEILQTVQTARLKLITAGRRDASFGERLTDRDAQNRLRDLFVAFDEVIVDSPPVLALSHALVLATLVDEVVLVLRAGHSHREEAEAAREYLKAVGSKISGAILNGVDPKTARYGYGYGYGDDKEYEESSA